MSKKPQPAPEDDEPLAFYTTEQLITEICKRFDTALFAGDTRNGEDQGDTKFLVWDRGKDLVRVFGLVEWAKFRTMRLLDDHSNPADLDFLS